MNIVFSDAYPANSSALSIEPTIRIPGRTRRVRAPRKGVAVVQLNSKISVAARDTLARVTLRRGRTIRSSVETGILLLDVLATYEESLAAQSESGAILIDQELVLETMLGAIRDGADHV